MDNHLHGLKGASLTNSFSNAFGNAGNSAHSRKNAEFLYPKSDSRQCDFFTTSSIRPFRKFSFLLYDVGTALVRMASLTPFSETPAGIPKMTHVSVVLQSTSSIPFNGADSAPIVDGSGTLVHVW